MKVSVPVICNVRMRRLVLADAALIPAPFEEHAEKTLCAALFCTNRGALVLNATLENLSPNVDRIQNAKKPSRDQLHRRYSAIPTKTVPKTRLAARPGVALIRALLME